MPDYDLYGIDAAVEEFRRTAPLVLPPGIGAARATVRRRRAALGVLASAVLVLAVVVPAAVFAGQRFDGPPDGVTATAPEPDLTPESSCATAATLPRPPAGGIAYADLCDGSIDVPVEKGDQCTGPQTVRAGMRQLMPGLFLNVGSQLLASDYSHTYVDIDGDGDAETILLLSCGEHTWDSRVLALDRAGDGTIHTIAEVTRTTAAVPRIMRVRAGPGGVVEVLVGDFNDGRPSDTSVAQQQYRGFRWNGSGFAQTTGPTTFPPNPRMVDVAVSDARLAFGPAEGELRSGTLRATLRNAGSRAVTVAALMFVPEWVHLVPQAGCRSEDVPRSDRDSITCTVTLEPDSSRVVQVTVQTSASGYTIANAALATPYRVMVGTADTFSVVDPDALNNQTTLSISSA